MSKNESDFGSYLAGFIIGGLVGAAVALLYAPGSGEETRTMIREKSIELKDKATETAEETRLRAERALDDAKLRASDAMEELRLRTEEVTELTRQRAADLQQRGQVVLEEQKTRLNEVVEAGKRSIDTAKAKLESTPAEGGETAATMPPTTPPPPETMPPTPAEGEI